MERYGIIAAMQEEMQEIENIMKEKETKKSTFNKIKEWITSL